MLAFLLTLSLCMQIAAQTHLGSTGSSEVKLPAVADPQEWEFWVQIPLDHQVPMQIRDMTATVPESGFKLTNVAVYGKSRACRTVWYQMPEEVVLTHRMPDESAQELGHSRATIEPHPFPQQRDGIGFRFVVVQHSYVNTPVILTLHKQAWGALYRTFAPTAFQYMEHQAKKNEARDGAKNKVVAPCTGPSTSQQRGWPSNMDELRTHLMDDEAIEVETIPDSVMPNSPWQLHL